jgi:hypothetical protein
MRFLIVLAAAAVAWCQTLTSQYDNARTGANPRETILTPRNVNAAAFGKQFVMPVDGDVFAQPLFVPKLAMPVKGVHDTIFVATEADSVYAFDAAGAPREPLWRVNFADPSRGITPVPVQDVSCSFIGPEIGITSTPAIDSATGTLYVVARTKENNLFYQRLHALDLATGAERPGSPVLIRATVPGTGLFGLTRKEIAFHALLENPRAALLVANGNVYIAWGSSCDVRPYYGWVLAYDARTLRQTGVFNAAPDAGEAGIWQSDTGIAADAEGRVFAVTGNGGFTAAKSGRDYGDSVLQLGLGTGGLTVRDYFTPYNEAELSRHDADLGASGPVLLPDQPGPHPHLLVTVGKDGFLYVVDRDAMGKYRTGSNSHAVQAFKAATDGGYGAPAYWNGHVYTFGRNDVLKDFPLAGGRLAETPAHQGTFRYHPATPSVSANGSKDGIVWLMLTKAWNAHDTYGILQAYDAADVSRLLYTSSANSDRDGAGLVTRFAIPMVANGRVYVGMRSGVYVYGLLSGVALRPAQGR